MTALLKEPEHFSPNVHARRIEDAKWAVAAQNVKDILAASGTFKPWEVDAITQAMIDIAKRTGGLAEEPLRKALHAKAFPKNLANSLASAISKAYG